MASETFFINCSLKYYFFFFQTKKIIICDNFAYVISSLWASIVGNVPQQFYNCFL